MSTSSPRELITVRTRFGHWASRSGYGLLPEYLQAAGRTRVREVVTNKIPQAAHGEWAKAWKRPPIPWYAPEDQLSECDVRRSIERAPADVVHFLDGENGYYYAQSLVAERRCAVAATYHQPPQYMDEHGILGSGDHIKHLDGVVIMSESQRAYMESFTDPERVAFIPHGVDCEHYRPAPRRAPRSRFVCLTVGFWLRDFDVLSEMARAAERREDLLFRIVGIGPGVANGSVCEEIHQTLKRQPNVELIDRVSDAELLGHYQDADALLLPLVDCTANNVLLEGMACGLPVITTDLPGTRDYVDPATALLGAPGDAGALLAELEGQLDDSARWEASRRACRSRAVERFDWRRIAREYEALYDRILPPAARTRSLRSTAGRTSATGARPGKRAVCTIVSPDYLPQALTMTASARALSDVDAYVLVIDENLDEDAFSRVHETLAGDAVLLRCSDLQRTLPGYPDEDRQRWALKPSLMLHLLEARGYEAVLFADCDVCFVADFECLFEALRRHSWIQTPHMRPIDPVHCEDQFAPNFTDGIFNAGFVGASGKALDILRWWETVCQYRCEKDKAGGFFDDQRYLDVIPHYFADAKALAHRGCNVGDWNLDQLPRVQRENEAFVEDWPVVFVHFTGSTIQAISEGRDPSLAPYLERYRALIDEVMARVMAEDLDLMTGSLARGATQTGPSSASRACPDLCTAVNFRSLPAYLMLRASIEEHFDEVPTCWVLCSDYESHRTLERLKLASTKVLHWRELGEPRLDSKQRQYANEPDDFRSVCLPVFVRHLLETEGLEDVLLLDPGSIFTAAPQPLIGRLLAEPGSAVLPRRARDRRLAVYSRYDYALALFRRSDPEFLAHWSTQVLRERDWKMALVANAFPEVRPDKQCARFRDPEGRVYEPGLSSGEARSVLAVYDETAVAIRGWSEPLARSCEPALAQRLTRCFERMTAAHGLSQATELDDLLSALPNGDLMRVYQRRNLDIRNFGEHMKEVWDADPSPVLKAYVLYLVGVEHRSGGRCEEARRILEALDGSRELLPDPYRAKIHVHLAELSEQAGELAAAARHRRSAGMHVADHEAARPARRRRGAVSRLSAAPPH